VLRRVAVELAITKHWTAFAICGLAACIGCGGGERPAKRASKAKVAAASAAVRGQVKQQIDNPDSAKFGSQQVSHWGSGGFSVSGGVRVDAGEGEGEGEDSGYRYKLDVNPDGKQRLKVEAWTAPPPFKVICHKMDDGREVCSHDSDDPFLILSY